MHNDASAKIAQREYMFDSISAVNECVLCLQSTAAACTADDKETAAREARVEPYIALLRLVDASFILTSKINISRSITPHIPASTGAACMPACMRPLLIDPKEPRHVPNASSSSSSSRWSDVVYVSERPSAGKAVRLRALETMQPSHSTLR